MNIRDYVREVGTVEDIDGRRIVVGVDYDSVSFDGPAFFRLAAVQAEEFGRLYVAACREAGANKRRMDEEAAEDARPDCVACWHLWTLHSDDGCTAKVFPAGAVDGERCPCEHAGTEAVQ